MGCLEACWLRITASACLVCPDWQVIRLSGYASDEKVAIARRYLEPQAASDSGVPAGAARLTDEALTTLINEYCR
jgi:Lon-like ATP-dependent protease